MHLYIDEYWSEVTPDPTNYWGTRVLPTFTLKYQFSRPNLGGWPDATAWRTAVERRHDFLGWVDGKAKIRGGSQYGIKSYQLVYLAE